MRIIDDKGMLPISLTSHEAIKRLINKYTLFKSNLNKERERICNQFEEITFNSKFKFLPEKPSKTIGNIKKRGYFYFNYNQRFIEIDPIQGSIRRYRNIKNYPNDPM